MLGKLRPDSWLHKEVRRKIEEVFLRNDDRAGLVTYYERWTKRDPEDVEALVRLGRTLATMGRVAEAQPWYEKAIKLAPGRRDLRLALIGQLAQRAEVRRGRRAVRGARPGRAQQPRHPPRLGQPAPARPDPRPRPSARPPRRRSGGSCWRPSRTTRSRPRRSPTCCARPSMVDEALALYRKAIEQAPANPQYREYLGEYLHQLKRPAEAMAEWAKIAEGPNRNAKNLGRLAEVLAGFGYVKEAIAPLDRGRRARQGRLRPADEAGRAPAPAGAVRRRRGPARRGGEAGEQATRRRRPCSNARVKNDQAAGRLAARIEAMRQELEGDRPATTADGAGCELARYLEADGKLPEAVRAADRADRRSSRDRSRPGRWRPGSASRRATWATPPTALRRLAEVDRRNRAEYLTGIARLESRLGPGRRRDQGRPRPAGRRARPTPSTTSSSPQLCFQLGRSRRGSTPSGAPCASTPTTPRSS